MSDPNDGFVTMLRVIEGDWLFSGSGKLAAVWFDRLIIHMPEADSFFTDGIAKIGEVFGWSHGTIDEVMRLCMPYEAANPTYQPIADPYDARSQLSENSVRVTIDQLEQDFPSLHPNEFMRQASHGAAVMIEGLHRWEDIRVKRRCILLPTRGEQAVIDRLSQLSMQQPAFDAFTEVVECRLPDAAALSWDQVIELRFNPFFQQFRTKVGLVRDLVASGEYATASEAIDELKQKDLAEMARFFRPSRTWTVLRGLASNIPLPLVLNPLSFGIAIRDYVKEEKNATLFGWLHFLLDIEGQ